MIKGNDIVGRSVIAYDTGKEIAKVEDVIFDQHRHQIIAFVVDKGGWHNRMRVLPWSGIQSVGPYAVVARSKNMIVEADQLFEVKKILERKNIKQGTQIKTTDGRHLGEMVDVYFDRRTGRVEGYEVADGVFTPSPDEHTFVPASKVLQIDDDLALVPPKTAELMQEKAGGIKAALETLQHKFRHLKTYWSDKTLQPTDEQPPAGKAKLDPETLLLQIMDQLKGCRVKYDLKTNDGFLVAAAGQIINDGVIERARELDQILELLLAAGFDISRLNSKDQP